MANELIKVTKQTIGSMEINAVDARDLHSFLEVKSEFRNWIKNRIDQYGFVQGIDFIAGIFLPGSDRKDYTLSIDMAKELSMVERNDKGKEARQYFINCERQAKQKIESMSQLEVLQVIINKAVEQERRQKQLEDEQAQLKQEHNETKAQLSALVNGENMFTVVGYCNLIGKQVDRKAAATFGKFASALCREKGIDIGSAPHPVYGKINSYPRDILDIVVGV